MKISLKSKIRFMKSLIVCFMLMLGISTTSFAATKTFSSKTVDSQKIFNIKFNKNINVETIKNKIVVKKSNGTIISTKIDVENNIVKVKAPEGGYIPGEYTLSILDNIKSTCNKSSKHNYVMKFNVVINKNIGNLKVDYINVGQGDSILVQQDQHNMLIDAGPNATENTVVNYIRSLGIKRLDYVIGTHPHEDHIGGLDKVIDSFEIGQVLMPNKISTTGTYKDVITSIKNKNLKITSPVPGTTYKLGVAEWSIFAPAKNKDYESVNNYSIVQKLKFGNTSFVFTGDAEAISEMEMVKGGYDLQADVLKIGHHGSKTSTCQAFLDKVSPKYVVISCGKYNKYKHPNKSTMDRLKSKNIAVYRTDESGTVVATSDGKDITFNCKEGTYNNGETNKPSINPDVKAVSREGTVYITKSGKKFHRDDCGELRKSKFAINREDAIKKGYIPCSKCNP